MINRLREMAPDPEESEPDDDYWVVSGDCGCFYVSAETAAEIVGTLRRALPPRRIRFRDLSGAEVWLSTREIGCVNESTREQRARRRCFHRARRDEQKADRRPWEDDEWWFD